MLKFVACDGSTLYVKKDTINAIRQSDDGVTEVRTTDMTYLVQGSVADNFAIYDDTAFKEEAFKKWRDLATSACIKNVHICK